MKKIYIYLQNFKLSHIILVKVMAVTLTLNGSTSVLTCEYFPSIELSDQYEYDCGLVDFQTFNSIPNVDINNNLFHIADEVVEIPIGSYEIEDIANFIQTALENGKKNMTVTIWANNNTLQSMITANAEIYFNRDRSIGSLLGFSQKQLNANVLHLSDLPVNITKVNVIRIECNIISGSYINERRAHTLHEFSPSVGPGYKIVEVPRNVIYLPVTVKRISSITLKLVDQNGDIINFRGETVTVRLHLKPHNVTV